MSDLKLMAYLAADAVRRRRHARSDRVSLEEMGRMVARAHACLKHMRSIRRIQTNRDITERHDLGGEG